MFKDFAILNRPTKAILFVSCTVFSLFILCSFFLAGEVKEKGQQLICNLGMNDKIYYSHWSLFDQ